MLCDTGRKRPPCYIKYRFSSSRATLWVSCSCLLAHWPPYRNVIVSTIMSQCACRSGPQSLTARTCRKIPPYWNEIELSLRKPQPVTGALGPHHTQWRLFAILLLLHFPALVPACVCMYTTASLCNSHIAVARRLNTRARSLTVTTDR